MFRSNLGSGGSSNVLIDPENSEPYIHDVIRNKWLSTRSITVEAGRNRPKVSNLYLRTVDGMPTTIAPFIMPYNGTMIGITGKSKSKFDWRAEVRINHNEIQSAGQIISNGYTTNFTKDVNFEKDDELQIYLNGDSVAFPTVSLIFSRRL